VGLSPASFKDEVLKHLWPKKYHPKLRLVWLNRDDPPPSLPLPWTWHEAHKVSTEALLDKGKGGLENKEQKEGGGGGGGGGGGWGDAIFVVMGAGCSVQDFAHLKVAWANAYPFDKELLQVGREGWREGGKECREGRREKWH